MNCPHHWILEAPQHLTGDTEGRCKLCGETRTFHPDREWSSYLMQRSTQARAANRKGQPIRHPKAVAS